MFLNNKWINFRSCVGEKLFTFRKDSFHSRQKISSEASAPTLRPDLEMAPERRISKGIPSSTESTSRNLSGFNVLRGNQKFFTRRTHQTLIPSIRRAWWMTIQTRRTRRAKILTDFTSLRSGASSTMAAIHCHSSTNVRRLLQRRRPLPLHPIQSTFDDLKWLFDDFPPFPEDTKSKNWNS